MRVGVDRLAGDVCAVLCVSSNYASLLLTHRDWYDLSFIHSFIHLLLHHKGSTRYVYVNTQKYTAKK